MNGSGPGVSGATHLSVSQGRGHNKAGLDCRSASRMARSQDRQRGVGCWGGGLSSSPQGPLTEPQRTFDCITSVCQNKRVRQNWQ